MSRWPCADPSRCPRAGRSISHMTMATINLLIGIEGIFIALGVAAMALAYAVEGLRARGGLRRLDLLVAVVLGCIVWGSIEGIEQTFARASDARLLSEAANAGA